MSNVSPFSEVRFVVKSIESRGFIWKESVLCHKETQLTRCTWCCCSDTIYSPERLLGLLMPFKLDLVMVQISTVTVYIPEWLIMLSLMKMQSCCLKRLMMMRVAPLWLAQHIKRNRSLLLLLCWSYLQSFCLQISLCVQSGHICWLVK